MTEREFLKEEQTPTDYLSIRVVAVHVKKGLFGLKDIELGRSVCIPDDREKALELYEKLSAIMKEYGVEVKPKETTGK